MNEASSQRTACKMVQILFPFFTVYFHAETNKTQLLEEKGKISTNVPYGTRRNRKVFSNTIVSNKM